MLTKVLVCDELPIVREGLRKVLLAEPDIEVIGATDSGIEALVLVRRMQPHVVITDATLSGLSGIELTRRLQHEQLTPAPRVLVFTLADDEAKIINFLEAGATGMVMKETDVAAMPMAVRSVAADETILAPWVTRKLLDWFFQREQRPDGGKNPVVSTLSQREREVLSLIARGLSSQEIAAELHIGEATVRTHVYRTCRKLNVPRRAHLVAFAYRSGLASAARDALA